MHRSDLSTCGLCMSHRDEVQLQGLIREKGVKFNTGECVGNDIVHSMNVTNGRVVIGK